MDKKHGHKHECGPFEDCSCIGHDAAGSYPLQDFIDGLAFEMDEPLPPCDKCDEGLKLRPGSGAAVLVKKGWPMGKDIELTAAVKLDIFKGLHEGCPGRVACKDGFLCLALFIPQHEPDATARECSEENCIPAHWLGRYESEKFFPS